MVHSVCQRQVRRSSGCCVGFAPSLFTRAVVIWSCRGTLHPRGSFEKRQIIAAQLLAIPSTPSSSHFFPMFAFPGNDCCEDYFVPRRSITNSILLGIFRHILPDIFFTMLCNVMIQSHKEVLKEILFIVVFLIPQADSEGLSDKQQDTPKTDKKKQYKQQKSADSTRTTVRREMPTSSTQCQYNTRYLELFLINSLFILLSLDALKVFLKVLFQSPTDSYPKDHDKFYLYRVCGVVHLDILDMRQPNAFSTPDL